MAFAVLALVACGSQLLPIRFQDEPKTRRTLSLWRGANEAHIRSDCNE